MQSKLALWLGRPQSADKMSARIQSPEPEMPTALGWTVFFSTLEPQPIKGEFTNKESGPCFETLKSMCST